MCKARAGTIAALVCREYDILCEQARGGGSHHKVAHPAVREKWTIFFRPVKALCVRKPRQFIDAVRRAR